jgi:hypothetical protein
MRKSMLKDGTICMSIKVEHKVTADNFALALRNHFYREGDPFPPKLKRTDALRILKAQLRAYGEDAPPEIDTELEFEAETAKIAKLYDRAEEWVTENYPFLTGPINKPK